VILLALRPHRKVALRIIVMRGLTAVSVLRSWSRIAGCARRRLATAHPKISGTGWNQELSARL